MQVHLLPPLDTQAKYCYNIHMNKICSVKDCNNSAWAKGWCGKHYQRWRKSGTTELSPEQKVFGITGPCSIDGCEKPVRAKGMCSTHYDRQRRTGSVELETKLSSEHANWRGGRIIVNGYVKVHVGKKYKHASMVDQHGYILEHRKVVAESLGRALSSKETVHHINGIKDDNRLENLQLRDGHHGQGVVRVCRDCGSNDIETVEL